MGHVIQMHGDPHEQTQALLPWFVTGTLDAAEVAMVEAHLAECEECRTELESERAIGKQVARMSLDVDHGWAAMRERIEAAPRPGRAAMPFLRRPIAMGWALAGQIAAAVVLVVAIGSWRTAPVEPSYIALGSPEATAPGNAIILFKPEISERAMREALSGVGARVVDGPMANGAYLLRLPADQRTTALGKLRGTAQVVLAEPLDAGNPP